MNRFDVGLAVFIIIVVVCISLVTPPLQTTQSQQERACRNACFDAGMEYADYRSYRGLICVCRPFNMTCYGGYCKDESVEIKLFEA